MHAALMLRIKGLILRVRHLGGRHVERPRDAHAMTWRFVHLDTIPGIGIRAAKNRLMDTLVVLDPGSGPIRAHLELAGWNGHHLHPERVDKWPGLKQRSRPHGSGTLAAGRCEAAAGLFFTAPRPASYRRRICRGLNAPVSNRVQWENLWHGSRELCAFYRSRDAQ